MPDPFKSPQPETLATAAAVLRILYRTQDPTTQFEGRPAPAMTTMLYRVCDNDEAKFGEATRLVELFIRQALATKGPAS